MAIKNTDDSQEVNDESLSDDTTDMSQKKTKILVNEFNDEAEDKIEVIDDAVQQITEDNTEKLELEAPTQEQSQQDYNEKSVVGETEATVGDAIDAATIDEENDLESDEDINVLVDDIVREESDEQLAEADAKLAAESVEVKKTGIKERLRRGVSTWWHTAWLRNTSLVIFVVSLAALVLVPTTRYAMLNTVGVRVQSSMTVIDSQTRLPLKNIQVALQDKTANTDKQGQVSFEDLKLGNSQLEITKRGYADNSKEITLGWGSNPIGDQEIIATGEQFTFILTDWLSNERVTDAEATAGESSANSDDDGKIILTIDELAIGDETIIISAGGYRDEKIDPSDLIDGDIVVAMVPDKRHAFVSNRDGKFDVYVIDLDGKNEELLVAATKKEREVPGILPHPTKNKFALVSSRDGVENTDNYILDGLFIVDATTGAIENIGRSERIQLLGWSNDSLVYTQVIEGTSRENAERSKLISFNNVTGEKTELAAANYFNDIELVDETVTYAVSSFAVPQSRAKLYSVSVDGTEKKQLLDLQVYTIFRTSQNTLLYNAVDQKWFLQTGSEDPVATEPILSPLSRNYVSSPDGSKLMWTETRDGKGVLFVSDRNGENQQEIITLAGLDSAEYWANDQTVIFRIIKSEETADYVLNLMNPEDIRKISDITASKRVFF